MADQHGDELERVVAEVVSGPVRPSGAARVAAALARRVRQRGARSAVDGSLASELLAAVVPRLELRDAAGLRAAYPGMGDDEVAAELIRSASLVTAAIGGACGAIASTATTTGAGVVTIPAPLLADTVLTALVEIRLVAELHAAYGVALPQPPTSRAATVLRAWASGRAMRDGAAGGGGIEVTTALRGELGRLVRRRLTSRATRSLVSVGPVLTGAVAAAELNRRGTRALGQRVALDLGGTRRRRWRRRQ